MTTTIPVSRSLAWAVWSIATAFYAYQYILRVMPNIMLQDIMQRFQLDAATFGQFSGVYYLGYSLMHLPIGLMLDRYGPRRVLSGCMLMTVVGLLPLLLWDVWTYPLAGRALIGIGSSAAILGTFKVIRMAFHEKVFTRMLSLSVTLGLTGAIYGGGPLGYLCRTLGYETVLTLLILLGLVLSVLTYMIIPEGQTDISTHSLKADIKDVLGNTNVLLLCLLAGLMVGTLEGFADVWGTAFLKQVYGLQGPRADSLPSLIFVGMCFGAPLLSFIAERTGYYLGTISMAALLMGLGFIALLSGRLTLSTLSAVFILMGVCCAYQILAIYKASTYVKGHVAGLTTALANMIIMIFGYGFHTVIGSVIELRGGTQVPQAFIEGIAVIPTALGISLVGLGFLAWRTRAHLNG